MSRRPGSNPRRRPTTVLAASAGNRSSMPKAITFGKVSVMVNRHRPLAQRTHVLLEHAARRIRRGRKNPLARGHRTASSGAGGANDGPLRDALLLLLDTSCRLGGSRRLLLNNLGDAATNVVDEPRLVSDALRRRIDEVVQL